MAGSYHWSLLFSSSQFSWFLLQLILTLLLNLPTDFQPLFLRPQGTYIACEQILSTTNTASNDQNPVFLPSPMLVNSITFLLPIACAAFAIPISLVAGYQWKYAYQRFQNLQEIVLASPSTSPTSEERDLAARIWKDWAYSWRTISIGFLIWAVVAVLFTLLVLCFGTFLIRALNTHLNECRQNGNATYQQTQTITAYWPQRNVPEDAKEHAKQGRMTARAKRVVLS